MTPKSDLKMYLQGTLKELNKLSAQIRDTQDYSEHAEYILTLRELILEQIEGATNENSNNPTHATR
ncbi:MAG: hypothetical protein SGI74_11455 [Oligoflexia bacterium]|nr:hypothetical protein [Oligoflexia bacterium]